MKKYILGILALILVFTFTSCDDTPVVFDNVNGQEAIQFVETSLNVTVPAEGIMVTLPVSVTTVSTAARSFTVVEDESSTAIPGSFSLGSVSIPAGSYDGSLEVTLNTTGLADGLLYGLVVNLVAPEGGATFNDQATINYNKEVICNDVVVTINTDFYGEETRWEITDNTGAIVVEVDFNTYPRGYATYTYDINLPDGCYTFTIYDTYCDGQQSARAGGYSVNCSILTHASGTSTFDDNDGCFESTDFAINVKNCL